MESWQEVSNNCMKTLLKFFIYVRKSSEAEDRQVASIDAQIDELKKIAKDLGLVVVEIFTESQSAKAPGRPVFNQMMQRVYAGEANGILCWKLDRLARNPVDGGQVSWALQQGVLQSIQTYGRTYLPTDNVLMMAVELGMANQFVRDLSVNVKRGLRKKAQDGWLTGVAPAGYLNTPDRQKGFKVVVKDPERFPLVRRAWDLMLTGNYTVPQIWQKVNNEWGYKTVQRRTLGGKPLSRSGMYVIFTNPFYYGSFEFPEGSGNWIKGAHEPMITEVEYDRVQILLGRKGKPRPHRHQFAFTGLMRCGGCGAAITAEHKTKRQKNGNIHHYVYYHCTWRKDANCIEKSVELKELNRQIDEVLSRLTISEKFKEWAIKYLHEVRTTEAQTQEIGLKNKHKELEEVVGQLDALMLKYTSPDNASGSLISTEELQTLKGGLLKRKSSLEEEIKGKGASIEEWLELSERTFNFARYARTWFENGSDDTRRAILSCLGSNLVLKDQKLHVGLHPVFLSVIEHREKVETELAQVRTSESPLFEGRKGITDPKNPALLLG
jgi:site-specific DNA recombinase